MHRFLTRAADEEATAPQPAPCSLTSAQRATAGKASRALRGPHATFVLADDHGTGKTYVLAEVARRLSAVAEDGSTAASSVVWACATGACCRRAAEHLVRLRQGGGAPKEGVVVFRAHAQLSQEDALRAGLLILDDAHAVSEVSPAGRLLQAVGHRVGALVFVTPSPFALGPVQRVWSLRLGLWRAPHLSREGVPLHSAAYRAYQRSLRARGALGPLLMSLDLALSGSLSATAFTEELHVHLRHVNVELSARRAYDELLAARAGDRKLRAWETEAKASACIELWRADLRAGRAVVVSLGPRSTCGTEICRRAAAELGTGALLTSRVQSRTLGSFQSGRERLLVVPYRVGIGMDIVSRGRPVKQYILDTGQKPEALQAMLGQCRRLGALQSATVIVLLRTLHDGAAALRCAAAASVANAATASLATVALPECLPVVLLELFVRLLVSRCPSAAVAACPTDVCDVPSASQLRALHALCAFVTAREWARLDATRLTAFAETFLPLCVRTHACVQTWLAAEPAPTADSLHAHAPLVCKDTAVQTRLGLPADVWLYIALFCHGRALESACIISHTGPRLLDSKTVEAFQRRLQYVPLRLQDQVRQAWRASSAALAISASVPPLPPFCSVEAYLASIIGPEAACTAMELRLIREGSRAQCTAVVLDLLPTVQEAVLYQDARSALAVRDARAPPGAALRLPGSGVRALRFSALDRLSVGAWDEYRSQSIHGREYRSTRLRAAEQYVLLMQCSDLWESWEGSARRLLYGREADGRPFAGVLLCRFSRTPSPSGHAPLLRSPGPVVRQHVGACTAVGDGL